jgi:hypothetical protein
MSNIKGVEKVQTGYGGSPSLIVIFTPRRNHPRRETKHLYPSIAEVKNEPDQSNPHPPN